MAFGYHHLPDISGPLIVEIKQTFQPFKALQTLGREEEATCDNLLREVFDLSKHWARSRTPQETFFTQVVGQKGHKDLHLLEAKAEFCYFVLSELSFTNKCASITKAEKITDLCSPIWHHPDAFSAVFLGSPAIFLNCILTALSLLPHFNRQMIFWWALGLYSTSHLPHTG